MRKCTSFSDYAKRSVGLIQFFMWLCFEITFFLFSYRNIDVSRLRLLKIASRENYKYFDKNSTLEKLLVCMELNKEMYLIFGCRRADLGFHAASRRLTVTSGHFSIFSSLYLATKASRENCKSFRMNTSWKTLLVCMEFNRKMCLIFWCHKAAFNVLLD